MEIELTLPTVEIDGQTYSRDEQGNLLTADGTVFKTKDELANPPVDTTVEINGKSYKVDTEGNALNEDGTVFKAKAEISTPTEEEIEIDGVVLKLNANGDAIDANGNIVKSKAEIDTMSAVNENVFDINSISAKTGLGITIEGKQKTYSNDETGVAEYTKDLYTIAINQGKETALKDLYSINPLVKQFVEHVQLHGTAENFNKTISYTTHKLDETNEDGLISVIRASRKAKGDSESDITKVIHWAKNDNALLELAKSSLSYLQSIETEEQKNVTKKVKEKEEEDALNYKTQQDTLKNIVTKGKITVGDAEIDLPKLINLRVGNETKQVSSDIIIQYLTDKYEYNIDGKLEMLTPLDAAEKLERKSRTTEEQILKALYYMSGTTINDLVSRKINTAAVKQIRKVVSSQQTTPQNTNKSGLILKYN